MARPKLKLVISDEQREELTQRYQGARGARERERMRTILLAVGGEHTYEEIAQTVGRARSLIQRWVGWYQVGGLEELLQIRKARGQSSPMTQAAVQAGLEQGLKEGRWRTGAQLAAWLEQEHGIKRQLSAIYYWLGKVGGALKVPRPVHQKKEAAASESFRTELTTRLQALQVPEASPVRIWIMDEHRYGLQPVQRRAWGWPGHRLVRPVHPRYQWGYVYGAIDCVSGGTEIFYTDGVSQEATADFYRQLQATAPQATHVIIADQAGFHLPDGHALLPAGVRVLPLPPYSPELNPVEKLWDVLQDHLANQLFATLEKVEEAMTQFFTPYWDDAKLGLRLIGEGWLQTQANAS